MLYPWVNKDAHVAEINYLTKKLIRNRLWSKWPRLKNLSETGYGANSETKKTYQKSAMEQTAKTEKNSDKTIHVQVR